MEVKVSEEVQTALVKFDAGPVTPQQFAQHLGFTERDMYFLDIFQPAIFDKRWILLDREMAKEWFCKNDTSAKAINHFIDRVLLKFFIENVDYKKADENDSEVIKSQVPNLVLGKIHTGGKKKHDFWITGECLKAIGMMQNREIRDYYLKIEKVFYQMAEYMIQSQIINVSKKVTAQLTMSNEAIETARKEVEHATATAEEQKQLAKDAQFKAEIEQKNAENARADADAEKLKTANANKRADDIAKDLATAKSQIEQTTKSANKWVAAAVDTALVPKLNVMYIASNKHLMAQKKFKIGGDENIKNCMKRIQGYCTMYPSSDPVYIIKMYQCYDYKAVEDLFWITGDRFRDKQGSCKEMIWLEGAHVIRILEDALWSIDQNVASHVSQYVEFKRSTVEDEPEFYGPLDLSDMVIRKQKKSNNAEVINMTDAEMQAIIIEKINICVREIMADYDFSIHKNERGVKISWKLFAPTFDNHKGKTRTEWRAMVKLLCMGTKLTINFREM